MTLWCDVITQEWNQADLAFLKQQLRLEPPMRVLDIPCGSGRLGGALAEEGFVVTGVDLSEEFLAIARRSSSRAEWRLEDMREIELAPGTFDAAFCWGNSFGYLSHEQGLRFLSQLARALTPGGRVAIDVPVAAECILTTLESRAWYQVKNIYMLAERKVVPEASRLDINYTFIENGVVDVRPASSYIHTIAELTRMFEQAGFRDVQLFGSNKGEPFQMGNRNLIIVAEKR